MSHPDAGLLERLRGTIRDTVGHHIPGGTPVALLNYPNHNNVGDSAIWLGEVSFLADSGCEVVYTCDLHSYNPRRLREVLDPHGLVLLHGGGNFGDLWPIHQRFREQVLSDLAEYHVLVFPQTIHFQDKEALARSQASIGRHKHLTIIARDERSRDLARSVFSCPVDLAPDMAFWLQLPGRTANVEQAVLWMLRTDIEAAASAAQRQGTASVDWLSVDRRELGLRDWLAYRTLQRTTGLAKRSGGRLPLVHAAQSLLFDRVAGAHLRRGLRLLSTGGVVVADRLHAHILCLLMGIPQVLLDNNYGKLESFWSTWTQESQLTRWSDNVGGAEELARRLAAL